jgi:hypothetical protein
LLSRLPTMLSCPTRNFMMRYRSRCFKVEKPEGRAIESLQIDENYGKTKTTLSLR